MDFFELFYNNLVNTGLVEYIAVLAGITSVWFEKRENILVYPVGIVNVLLYVYICFNARLYADSGINLFYFVVSVFGWYNWSRKKSGSNEKLHISINTLKQKILYFLITVVAFAVIVSVLMIFNRNDQEYVSSYVPWIDAGVSAVCLMGMWLCALKRVDNWYYYIIGNAVSIPMYISKGLVFTSFQYLVFLTLSIMGLIEWKKKWEKANRTV
ncbi:MAG: nicotinamide riboside transporter PnuC [Lentimicrobiaceae bacterium]